jgi:hypothetical protein
LIRQLITRPGRRSARIPLSARLILTATEAQDRGLRIESDTINVSSHGARICTSVILRPDMQVRVFLPWRNRIEMGRVVWSRVTSANEYGIELDSCEDFWGLPFSPDRWPNLERERVDRTPAPSGVHTAMTGDVSVPPDIGLSQESAPGRNSMDLALNSAGLEARERGVAESVLDGTRNSGLSIVIPASGLQVLVSGLTMSGMPFRENSILLAEESKESTAFVWLHSVIRDGVRLRLVFPNRLTTTVRVRATLANSSRTEASPVIVEFPAGIFLSRELPAQSDTH